RALHQATLPGVWSVTKRPPYPDVIVMERGSAVRRDAVRTRQRVEAHFSLELLVRRNGLDNHHAALHAVIGFRRDADLATLIAHGDAITVLNAQCCEILGMDLRARRP